MPDHQDIRSQALNLNESEDFVPGPLGDGMTQGLIVLACWCFAAFLAYENILVPSFGAEDTFPERSVLLGSRSRPLLEIEINEATVNEFDLLPGIGPILARRIIDDRNANGRFLTFEQIERVKGIGEKKLRQIEKYCVVEPNHVLQPSFTAQPDASESEAVAQRIVFESASK